MAWQPIQDRPSPLDSRSAGRATVSYAWLTVIGIVLVVVPYWYLSWLRPHQIHSQAYHRLSDAVDSLARRRPAQVTRNEWRFLIGWTRNAIGNCCSIPEFLNPDRASHDRFLTLPDRFEERIAGEVGIDSIDWLWDELEIISKYGAQYSKHWRPTTPEHLAEADHVTIGPEVP